MSTMRQTGFAALLLSTSVLSLGSAWAEPVILYGSDDYGDIAVQSTLRGDLSGSVLTLNAGAPTSKLRVAPAPIPDWTQPFNPSVDFPCSGGLVLNFTCHLGMGFSFRNQLTLLPWLADLGGAIDLASGLANLNASFPSGPVKFADGSGSHASAPTVQVTIDGGGIIAEGIANNVEIFLTTLVTGTNVLGGTFFGARIEGYWESFTLGSGTANFSQVGSTLDIVQALGPSTLTGYLDVELTYQGFTELGTTIGSTAVGRLQTALRQFEMAALSEYVSTYLDYTVSDSYGAFDMDCTGTPGSLVGRIDIDCTVSSQINYSGQFDRQIAPTVGNIPEPGTLGLAGLGFGVVGLTAWRRRRH